MLLSAFLAFTALGLSFWLLGHLLFQYEGNATFVGIAVIGAVILMATGGTVALDDVQQPTGQVVNKTYEEHNFTETGTDTVWVNNRSVYTQTRTRVSITDQFGTAFGQLALGGLELIIGALLLIADLEELSF